MPLFEHVFLARQDASAQEVQDLTTQMTGIVEGLGGKVVKMENWGVRSLTYRMNKNRKAHYILLNIDGPSAAITEIERQERISEDVIRYLTVRVEEHKEGPSSMLRKGEREAQRDESAVTRSDEASTSFSEIDDSEESQILDFSAEILRSLQTTNDKIEEFLGERKKAQVHSTSPVATA